MLSAIQLTPDQTFEFLLNVAITRPVFLWGRRGLVKVPWCDVLLMRSEWSASRYWVASLRQKTCWVFHKLTGSVRDFIPRQLLSVTNPSFYSWMS